MNLETLLIAVDFSDATDRVVDSAATIAKAFRAKAVVVHVSEPDPDFVGFEPGPQTVRAVVAHDFRAEHQKLEAVKQRLTQEGIETTALQIQGAISEKIVEEAVKNGAGMIVLGSHGHGALYHLLVGSVTAGVMKAAPTPVLVIPAERKRSS